MRNHYGSLCTEMYEALHPAAPEDELGFYLSYAQRGQRIFEPLCGSGRFLVPFLERGFDVGGMDSSEEMLAKLKQKAPDAQVVCATVEEWRPAAGEFGYLFITSGSLSLFTDADACRAVLRKVRGALRAGGVFAFAVDTVAAREPDSAGYEVGASVKQVPLRRGDAHPVLAGHLRALRRRPVAAQRADGLPDAPLRPGRDESPVAGGGFFAGEGVLLFRQGPRRPRCGARIRNSALRMHGLAGRQQQTPAAIARARAGCLVRGSVCARRRLLG